MIDDGDGVFAVVDNSGEDPTYDWGAVYRFTREGKRGKDRKKEKEKKKKKKERKKERKKKEKEREKEKEKK